ncbi:STAS domain-containing protein [Jatrophihabitans telluris]|uniref:Anti-sigma factor antagonist n=1 Tax=Jatrophihabitans telluris TaxID=2038343 RepID=A0ABY4R189_9ACTN|nr:STAS domain-containing protein [Jatrophihabitans telluris]UQX89016.1 STAS domain-containing protein [Jatrophihabitans telluris]
MSLDVDLSAVDGQQALVLRGDLDLETRSVVLARGNQALQELSPGERLVVDLANVGFVDSSGLGVLVALSNEGAARGCPVVMRRPSAAVSKLFELTGLDKAFEIEPARP